MVKIVEKAKAKYKKAQAVNRKLEKTTRSNRKKTQFSRRVLINEIMTEAKVLKRPVGATKIVAEKVADEVEDWAKKRAYVTEDDVVRIASKKIEKYDEDLAYIYKNRGKII